MEPYEKAAIEIKVITDIIMLNFLHKPHEETFYYFQKPNESRYIPPLKNQIGILEKIKRDEGISNLKIFKKYATFKLNREKFDTFREHFTNPDTSFSEYKLSSDSFSAVISIDLGKSRLIINKNTGDIKLNEIENQLNPSGDEFKTLYKLATSKDYIATYKNLLGENNTKTNRRNLSFTIRNIKEALLILPRKKAKNKDIIKNIRNYGYKLEA